MAFPTTGVANQIDRWRTWFAQGEFLGIEIPTDELIGALTDTNHEDVTILQNDEERLAAQQRATVEAKAEFAASPATQADIAKLAARIRVIERTLTTYSMPLQQD